MFTQQLTQLFGRENHFSSIQFPTRILPKPYQIRMGVYGPNCIFRDDIYKMEVSQFLFPESKSIFRGSNNMGSPSKSRGKQSTRSLNRLHCWQPSTSVRIRHHLLNNNSICSLLYA